MMVMQKMDDYFRLMVRKTKQVRRRPRKIRQKKTKQKQMKRRSLRWYHPL